MSGNYPSISSGSVFFENMVTGTKANFKIPKDLEESTYGVRDITMDPGASSTIFPGDFAKKIDIRKPPEDAEEYWIFSGVGGTGIGFRSRAPIRVGVEDSQAKLEALIFPFFLVKYAPSITSEGKLLSQYQPYTEKVIPFISPPFRYHSKYTVEVRSPGEKFPLQDKRLKLEVDVGQEMDYILIGRDWQEGFDILFKAEEMIIIERIPGRL